MEDRGPISLRNRHRLWKNRGGPMKEFQTIIAARASPKNVPTYSHRAEPLSPVVVSATPTPRHFSRPKRGRVRYTFFFTFSNLCVHRSTVHVCLTGGSFFVFIGLRQRLNDPPFVSGGLATCNNCHAVIDYHTWRELKYKIILEMDVRPAGDTILEHGLSEWPEALACWQAKCAQVGCSDMVQGSATIVERHAGRPE